MKKLSVLFSIIVLLGLLGCNQEGKEDLITQLKLGENAEFIEVKEADVTGDGTEDKVALVGTKIGEDDSPFRDNLIIIVKDGKSKEYIKATYPDFAGYEPKLKIKKLSGDGVKDVMVSANSGGSGGIYHHLIATFKDVKAKVIFDRDDNRGLEVSGQFIPNFKARLKFIDLEKEAIVDISENKEDYIKQRIYNREGALVQRRLIRPYSYPFSKLEAVDDNDDGQYELRGIQRIVGCCNADTIAEVESIWSYDDGHWILKELKSDNISLEYDRSNSESQSVEYLIDKKSLDIKNKGTTIFYPQIKGVFSEDDLSEINYRLAEITDVYAYGDIYSNVKINYKITKRSPKILSVLYEGDGLLFDNREINIQHSVNLNMNSRDEISYENFISDEEKVKEILDQKAREKGFEEGLEAEGIRLYFVDNKVVFYYMPLDDSATEFVQLVVAQDEIKEYINLKLD